MITMHKQLFRHRPDEGVWGDCHRTCVANLIGVLPEEVPHTHEDVPVEQWQAMIDGYLATKGLRQITIWWPKDSSYILETHQRLNPEIFYILSGLTAKGQAHSVLCFGGATIHNPSLDEDNDLVSPCQDDNYRTHYIVLLKTADPLDEKDFEIIVRNWRLTP